MELVKGWTGLHLKKMNESVFKNFFDTFYSDLVNYANAFLFDKDASEDIVQDVFIYIWENADQLNIENSFKAYLFRMVRNQYLKYQKEEDIWAIFKDLERNKLLFTKYPKKELFINRIITQEEIGDYTFKANLNITRSIESHSEQYNPGFWKNYNAPILTKELSKIEQYLKQAQINVKGDNK